MPVLYANRAFSTLASGITSSATSLSVAAGQGARFPAISGSDYFYATLDDNAGNVEIIRVTARSTDTFTIVRAQDGTSALAFNAGAGVELRIVKAMLDDFKTDARSGLAPLTGTGASGTWGISITGSAASAGAATYATYNQILDTRSGQLAPDDYQDYRATYEFTDKIVGSDWHSAITLQGWHNNYAAWQLIGPSSTSAHENWYLRSGVGASWNAARSILHSGNYNSYAPTLTGTGASGTWGVSVTGNAATATALQTARAINGTSFNGTADVSITEWLHSLRDFVNGTLITTSIDYSQTQGDPFVLQIRGNSYGSAIPFDIQIQGYIYYDTLIHFGGYSTGPSFPITAMNVGGKLCFWFARQAYWQGFNVHAYSAYASRAINKVESITDVANPNGTKQVVITPVQVLRSDNFSSYALPLSGGTVSGSVQATENLIARGLIRVQNGTADWDSIDLDANGTTHIINSRGAETGLSFQFDGVERMFLSNGGNLNVAGALTQNNNQVLHAGNYTSYTLPIGGGWYGSGLPGTRWNGLSVSGGEIVFGNGLPNAGQMGILIDGCYVAGENNGFWSLASDNSWGSRRGFYWDGAYLNFTANSATAYFSNALIGGNQVLHAGNHTSFSPSLTGGGASGTWGISITGNAATVSTVTPLNVAPVTDYTTPSDASGYTWIRFAFASGDAFNQGQQQIEFYVTRSINANDNTPYGGCTAKFTAQAREWHSGQEMMVVQYGEHGQNASAAQGFYITHARIADLAGGGSWFYLRVRAGITYRFREVLHGGAGCNFATLEGGTDPGSAQPIYSGLNLISSSGDVNFYDNGNAALHAGNYNSYAPTLTGTGASGTWGINISGNAATATSAMLRSSSSQADPNTIFSSSAYRFDPNANNPTNEHYAIITYGNESNVTAQLATHFVSGQTFTRAHNSAWSAWRTQLDSVNFGSFALPLSGGALTGSLLINTSGSGSSSSHFIIKRSGANTPGSFGSYAGSWRSSIEIWNNDSTRMLFLNPPENDSLYGHIKSIGGGLFVDVGSNGATRAIQIESSGAANFPVGLARGGNAVLDAGNYNSYALPLSGGTLTGRAIISAGGRSAHYSGSSAEVRTEDNTPPGVSFHRVGYSATLLYEVDGELYVAPWTTRGQTGKLLAAGNFTDFTVSKGGTGATGTWDISISGTAANASAVSGLTLTSSANGINPDTVTQNQIGYNTSVSLFGQTDGGLYSSAFSGSWVHQIYGDFRTGQIAIRGKNSGTWQAWRAVLDSSNYTSYALPISGGTLSGGLAGTTAAFSGGFANADNGIRIANPGGASYSTSASSVTGAIKIRLPASALGSNSMISFRVRVYQYSTGLTQEFVIAGYNYNDANWSWYNVSAMSLGDAGGDFTVRFGKDDTSQCVYIGELTSTWSYPQVHVTDFSAGYSGFSLSTWATGWNISFESSAFAGVTTSRTAWRVLSPANINSYSPSLTGGGASGTWGISITGNAATVGGIGVASAGSAPGANQIVRTDGNGYTFTGYINSNTGNSENPAISQVVVTNGSDNYYRKASIAHLTSNLSGIAPISITGNAATATTASNGGVQSVNGVTGAVSMTGLGSIGCYAVLMIATNTNVAAGSTVAGSDLRHSWTPNTGPLTVAGASAFSAYGANRLRNSSSVYDGGGTSFSGTWRKMSTGATYVAFTDSCPVVRYWLAALYVRIS